MRQGRDCELFQTVRDAIALEIHPVIAPLALIEAVSDGVEIGVRIRHAASTRTRGGLVLVVGAAVGGVACTVSVGVG